ncbi:MAG: DUF4105 domain-containing protein [Candidatus Ozemobacteraceae bacterium]
MKMRHWFLVISFCLFLNPAFASVPYTLEGCVNIDGGSTLFHTADGRVFKLDMNLDQAKKYDDKYVIVEGIARECDEVSVLKVSKITLHDPKIPAPKLESYKDYQRPTHMVSRNADSIVMDNVRWGFDPKAPGGVKFFWESLTIKPELVEKVFFIKKPFPPEWLAAHCLMAYTFKPGGLVNAKGQSAKALVLSVEAYQRKDQNYSLQAGLKKTFGIVWLLATWDDYSTYACDLENKKLFAYPVKFTHEQKVKLIRETMTQAAVDRQGEFYHTVTNNCTNDLVVLFNKVMEKKIRMWLIPSLIYNLRATMPTLVPSYLIKKGILEKSLPEINKTNYFGDLLK